MICGLSLKLKHSTIYLFFSTPRFICQMFAIVLSIEMPSKAVSNCSAIVAKCFGGGTNFVLCKPLLLLYCSCFPMIYRRTFINISYFSKVFINKYMIFIQVQFTVLTPSSSKCLVHSDILFISSYFSLNICFLLSAWRRVCEH